LVHRASVALDADDAGFIAASRGIADKLADEQKNRNLPGGVVVVFSGTAGHPARRLVGVIKAEVHNGFMREREAAGEKPKLKFLKSLMLTAQTKLYKVGLFMESQAPVAGEFPAGWDAYIYDETLTVANRYGAAKYFYDGFLGLGFPQSSARQTLQFFDLTKAFIQAVDKPEEEKIVLHNALVTYLRADQTPTVGIASFADAYFGDAEARDAYRAYMVEKGFPEVAINKDTTEVASAMKLRRLNFASRVRISGPADSFDKLVAVSLIDGEAKEGVTPKWTQVIIKDRISTQE
ncbi:nucleoid-associated protein, partial [Burkholderia gladioli]